MYNNIAECVKITESYLISTVVFLHSHSRYIHTLDRESRLTSEKANRYFLQTKRPCRSLFNFVPHYSFQ